MASPGWYPDPLGKQPLRWWDGRQWHIPHPRPQLPKLHWAVWVGVGCVAVAVVVFGAFAVYNDNKPVRQAHSKDTTIEAFYREIEAEGFGSMKVRDVIDRGKKACDGDGLVLWGEANYSMADSFDFAAAAMQACPALRRH